MNLIRNAILGTAMGFVVAGLSNAQPELDTVRATVRVLRHDSTSMFL